MNGVMNVSNGLKRYKKRHGYQDESREKYFLIWRLLFSNAAPLFRRARDKRNAGRCSLGMDYGMQKVKSAGDLKGSAARNSGEVEKDVSSVFGMMGRLQAVGI